MRQAGNRGSAAPPPEKTLIIGLTPEHQIFKQVRRYEPLADYLSKKTGIQLTLNVLTYRGNVIDNFRFLKLDGAFFGSFSYVLAHAKLGVVAVARPEYPDGSSSYHGVLFVRKDSGIRTVRQMNGKRLALVARATTAGFLFPTIFLKRAGVGKPETFFKEVYFAGTHEGTIDDVLDRKADVGVSKNTVYDRFEAENPLVGRDLVILGTSDDVPENALVLRKDIEDSVRRKLLDALIAIHADPEGAKVLKAFGARRFIGTADADYMPVMTYTRELGIDVVHIRNRYATGRFFMPFMGEGGSAHQLHLEGTRTVNVEGPHSMHDRTKEGSDETHAGVFRNGHRIGIGDGVGGVR